MSGQWRALLRMFGLPVALLLGVHVTGSALSQLGFQRLATQASAVASSTFTNQSGTITSQTYSVSSTVVRSDQSGDKRRAGDTRFPGPRHPAASRP